MSQENVEAVRRMLVSIHRRDFGKAIRQFRPDAHWHNTGAFPGPTVCSGGSEITTFWTSLFEDFEEHGQLEVEQTSDLGDTVIVGLHIRGRGKVSGAPVDVRWAMTVRFEGGLIARVDVY